MTASPRRVGIVYPRLALDSVPGLCQAAELLARHGYAVDLLTYTGADVPSPVFASERVRVVPIGSGAVSEGGAPLQHALGRVGRLRPVLAPLGRGYRALRRGFRLLRDAQRQRRLAARIGRAGGYHCFIGVDPDGLVLAHALAGAGGAPVAYYSLELLLADEIERPAEARLKASERALARRAPFVIVQDEERGRLLAEDTGLAWERIVLVPNAPLGPARRQPSPYWRERLGLAPGQRVVLHAGSLGEWTGIDDIVASVPAWPADWVLVVHTRYDAESSAYLERLRSRAAPGRVFFSLKPVPRQEYDALIDGADLGVAFYVPVPGSAYTQRNIRTVGLSSGKLAYYLRAGLPVIVNRAASVGALVERAGCGAAVPGGAGIAPAIARLEGRYAEHSRRARAFFDAQLDFAPPFAEVLRRIDALAAMPSPGAREAAR